LRHLASAIVFMLDPSETCGYPIDSQLNLLESIKKDFEASIIEVENKVDLVRTESSRPKISALNDEGTEELRERILEIMPKKK
jgi:nucleolar GTP-binding protein